MRLHILSGGWLEMSRRVYDPDAVKGDRIELPVNCALIKHPQGNMLFDTGCHPDVATDAEGRWGDFTKLMTAKFDTEDAVVNQLHKADLSADDIDVVVCSHLHVDHCGCNSFFPKATFLCHEKEIAAAVANPIAYPKSEWDPGVPMTPINSQYDVFGDGRVTLLPLPGHTEGMTVAHVSLDNSTFLLASDSVPIRKTLEKRCVPLNNWDADQTHIALDEVERIVADGAQIIYGHDEQQWSELRKGEQFYD